MVVHMAHNYFLYDIQKLSKKGFVSFNSRTCSESLLFSGILGGDYYALRWVISSRACFEFHIGELDESTQIDPRVLIQIK